jgi:hypothetical protein
VSRRVVVEMIVVGRLVSVVITSVCVEAGGAGAVVVDVETRKSVNVAYIVVAAGLLGVEGCGSVPVSDAGDAEAGAAEAADEPDTWTTEDPADATGDDPGIGTSDAELAGVQAGQGAVVVLTGAGVALAPFTLTTDQVAALLTLTSCCIARAMG